MGQERVIIETADPDIILRQLVPEDAGPLFQLIDSDRPHLSQHGDNTADKYPDEASVLRSITNNDSDKLRFGIWKKHALLGCANLTPTSPHLTASGQLGYWIGTEYEGRGIMKSVARALVQYAETTLKWYAIFGYAHKENRASLRVLYRAGLRRMGIQEGDFIGMVRRVRK